VTRLAWKRHLRSVQLPPDDLILLSENAHYIFQGKEYASIAPLLDGSRSEEEIHAALECRGVPSFPAWLALSHFRRLGLLREFNGSDPALASEEVGFWESTGEQATVVADRLSACRAVIADAGGTGVQALRPALEQAGICVSGEGHLQEFVVAVADDYLDLRLDEVNRTALESGRSWMVVKLAGAVPWIGPLFIPRRTGCWACLAQRLRLNHQTERLIEARLGSGGKAPLPSIPLSLDLAAALAAVELQRWLATGKNEALEQGLLSIDLRTNQVVRHTLVRRPQCPACGTFHYRGATTGLGEAVRLGSSPKSSDGGRSEPPQATLARLEHHVSPITGAIRSVSESCENGYRHVSASQTFPMYRYDFRVLRVNLLGRSGGKGFDPEEARVSAICEALERYSCSWQGEEETVLPGLSRRALGGDALDPRSLFGFSARQYAEREAWNLTNDEPHAWVPRPFDDDLAIDWVPVWSVTHSRTRLVPAAYCYYGHPDLRHLFCSSDSNGCAAGSTLAEAFVHGLLELIERDAAAVWWYNRLPRPAVDLDSFNVPASQKLRDVYRAQGRDFWAIDLTNDLNVPVMAAISAARDSAVEDIIYGFGSDLNPSAALNKALLEMNQSLFSVYKTGSPGMPRYRTDQPAARRWFQSATRANQTYLVADPSLPPRTPADFTSRAGQDWQDDALDCVERLRRAGLETFALDQTRPDIGLSVCRALVPGLCHFWRRFGHRRLCQVPVSLGWKDAPTPEDELNPWFIYF
jgi:bacteriocin biosynthesis cyclodehydratase domain-containing protein